MTSLSAIATISQSLGIQYTWLDWLLQLRGIDLQFVKKVDFPVKFVERGFPLKVC